MTGTKPPRSPNESRTFLMHGLRVRSDVDLRHCVDLTDGRTDVELRSEAPEHVPDVDPPGRLMARLDGPAGQRLYAFSETEHDYCLRFFDAGQARVSKALDAVVWRPAPGTPPDLLALLFNGTIVSFLLLMRGHGLLHASAVELDGRALAYVGRSGLGKSTMAALSCAAGTSLVTDDVLRIDVADGAALCHRGAPENRLRREVEVVLGAAYDERLTARATADGRNAVSLSTTAHETLPLHAIVVPMPSRDIDRVVLDPVTGVNAASLLAAFPRLLGWQDEATSAGQFDFLVRLVQHVPVYAAQLPWGPPFSPDLARAVLLSTGLTAVLATGTPEPGE